jgi:hypothetical protein
MTGTGATCAMGPQALPNTNRNRKMIMMRGMGIPPADDMMYFYDVLKY